MSQALAAAATKTARQKPVASPNRPATRPELRIVRVPTTDRGRTLFIAGCLTLLIGGLLTLLLINTSLAQGSFRIHDLELVQRELADTEQALRQDLDQQSSPQRLAQRAQQLGMVPSDSTAFIPIPGGKVVGTSTPAARPKPTKPAVVKPVAPKPSVKPSANVAPKPSAKPAAIVPPKPTAPKPVVKPTAKVPPKPVAAAPSGKPSVAR